MVMAQEVSDRSDDHYETIESKSKATAAYNNYLFYKSRMKKFSAKNLEMGDERYRLDRELRDNMPAAFAFLEGIEGYTKKKGLPMYHAKTMAFNHQRTLQETIPGRTSAAQVGVRCKISRDAFLEIADKAAGTMVDALNHEQKKFELYRTIRENALFARVGARDFGGPQALRSTGRVLSQMATSAGQRANALAYEEAYRDANKESFLDKVVGIGANALAGYIAGGGRFGRGE